MKGRKEDWRAGRKEGWKEGRKESLQSCGLHVVGTTSVEESGSASGNKKPWMQIAGTLVPGPMYLYVGSQDFNPFFRLS